MQLVSKEWPVFVFNLARLCLLYDVLKQRKKRKYDCYYFFIYLHTASWGQKKQPAVKNKMRFSRVSAKSSFIKFIYHASIEI